MFKNWFKKKETLELGDTVTLRNNEVGTVIEYPSGNYGINIHPYVTLCEPLSNYNGLKHKMVKTLDIIQVTKNSK